MIYTFNKLIFLSVMDALDIKEKEAEIKAEKDAILVAIRAKNAENDVQKKQGLEEELAVLKASLEDLKTTRDKLIDKLVPQSKSHVEMPSRETISLEIYAPRATKTFNLVKTESEAGKINVKALLKEFRMKRLYFLESKVLLTYDDDGWSYHDEFIHDTVYKMRHEPDETYDVSIGYSDAKIENVEDHFNLNIGYGWLPVESYPQINIPDSLFKQLQLLRKRNTLYSENARRTLISLFIINAIEKSDEDGKLFVHEELSLSCVREENGIRYKYNGPIDFVIGPSPVDSKLKNDCTILFVEAKTLSKLSEALGQALAQAATIFIIRKQENKGVDVHLKVYWCISDGESWRFGYITEGKGATLDVHQSDTTTCWFHQSHMIPERESCSKLFSLIVWWIQQAMESSQTTSRRN